MMKRIFRQEQGQSMVEYAMIIAIIALGCVAVLGDLGLVLVQQLYSTFPPAF